MKSLSELKYSRKKELSYAYVIVKIKRKITFIPVHRITFVEEVYK